MDTVFLRGLAVEAVIGVHAWEQQLPRKLLIDLELAADAARAARSDRVADALDYAAVAAAVRAHAQASRHALLETLADGLATLLREKFGAPWLRLTIRKPGAVAGVEDIGVTIERGSR